MERHHRGLLAVLDQLLPETASVEDLTFRQKWGTIQIYDDIRDLPADVRREPAEVRKDAEDRSLRVCEICGNPGRLSKRGTWFVTVCPDHADQDGRMAFPVES